MRPINYFTRGVAIWNGLKVFTDIGGGVHGGTKIAVAIGNPFGRWRVAQLLLNQRYFTKLKLVERTVVHFR